MESKISVLLNNLMERHKLSQRQMAEHLGVDEATISRVANDKQNASGQFVAAVRMLEKVIEMHEPFHWKDEQESQRAANLAASVKMTVPQFAAECVRRYGLQTRRDLEDERSITKELEILGDAVSNKSTALLKKSRKQGD